MMPRAMNNILTYIGIMLFLLSLLAIAVAAIVELDVAITHSHTDLPRGWIALGGFAGLVLALLLRRATRADGKGRGVDVSNDRWNR